MTRAEREQLNRSLGSHLDTIHETFQVLDQAPSSQEKVSWGEVIQMGEQVSKQATIVGMLWAEEKPEIKTLEENMSAYFNILQGFLLLSHGSRVGAGPTLSSCIHASVKHVVDCSFMLFKESLCSYGSCNKDQKLPIPQLVGTVWDACSALKKTPSTNVTAIGRAMTHVAVSIKDVLRELKELKPGSSDLTDEATDDASAKAESSPKDKDNSSDGDLGNDLSPEEMKIAQLAIEVVSETLGVQKELIRSITGLIKQEDPKEQSNFVNSLERLLKLSQEIGLQVDELGACLYPPQEVSAMKNALEKITGIIAEMQTEVANLKSSPEAFAQACDGLRSSMRQLELGCSSATDLVPGMQNLVVSS
ncbi:uncharacterized protein LOC131153023 [Malania oleifera]|uniref:uncharacterized protein LOC131153023 n=1 Tax=Malania oleifera TaxID=397392 RepID=UPI0025AE618B|nr:uncharacterized protein LOC131153023 [Malania oleifera]